MNVTNNFHFKGTSPLYTNGVLMDQPDGYSQTYTQSTIILLIHKNDYVCSIEQLRLNHFPIFNLGNTSVFDVQVLEPSGKSLMLEVLKARPLPSPQTSLTPLSDRSGSKVLS